uniref:helix-turn-helix domain-containing protein n=1 Tax=Flavobacterium sp. TaxID=239 RepID=UPI00404B9EAE
MAIEVITKEDLIEFRQELLKEISGIVNASPQKKQKWLKSHEVRELLNISAGTLQNLRINGSLTYSKIGGTIYYDNDDILKLMESNKTTAKPTLFK